MLEEDAVQQDFARVTREVPSDEVLEEDTEQVFAGCARRATNDEVLEEDAEQQAPAACARGGPSSAVHAAQREGFAPNASTT